MMYDTWKDRRVQDYRTRMSKLEAEAADREAERLWQRLADRDQDDG